MAVYTYTVGKLFNPNRTSYEDTPYLAIYGEVMVANALASPIPDEVEQFDNGEVRFAWVDGEHLGVLAVKFGDLPWGDAPFTPHLSHGASQRLPDAYRTGKHQYVIAVLIDGDTGIIRSMRGMTWPPEFVDAVGATMDRLLKSPPSLQAHDAALDVLYDRYPTSADLVRDRADITCVAGTRSVAFGTGPDASPTYRIER